MATTLRFPLIVGHRRRVRRTRRLDGRLLALSVATAELALVGGLPLVALVAQMVARVLFIAFTIGGVVTLLLVGVGVVQKSTR